MTKSAAKGVLAGLALLLLLSQAMFQLSFRATYISPGPGWNCYPTWNYQAVCTDPAGRRF